MKRKLSVFLLSFVLFAMSFMPNAGAIDVVYASETTSTSSNAYNLPDKAEQGVMFHAYMWRFEAIKSNLKNIADAGYNSIQVSPVQKTKATGQWWLLYQPCNFHIGNAQLGTADEFKALCQEADKYGIKIIVDVVLNHVADNGQSGQWANEVDNELKRSELYHNQGRITDYNNRYQVTQQNLENLPDLATQRHDVQDMEIAFLNECISAGADGFRFDAAKHIETNRGQDAGQSWSGDFWDRVLGSLENKENLYLFGEVLPDDADNNQAYLSYFDITAHGYGGTLRNAVYNKDLSNILNINHGKTTIPNSKALCYVENHDDYEHGVSNNMTDWQRKMAFAIIGARAEITPRFLARPYDNLWKDSDLIAVNKFHNAMVGQNEYLRWPRKETVLIERGTNGMVIVNTGNDFYLNSDTKLKDGSYSNKGSNNCTVNVSGGKVTGNIPGGSVVVLYN